MTRYLTLRPNEHYSRPTPAMPLLAFLAGLPELRRVAPAVFAYTDGCPWLSLVVASCDSTGSYNSDGNAPVAANVVSLSCSDEPAEWYDDLARRVAAFLRWEVIDDDEDRRLWPVPGVKKPRDLAPPVWSAGHSRLDNGVSS